MTALGVGGPTAFGASALSRIIRRPAAGRAAAERCDLCGTELLSRHRHLLDERNDGLLCTCQACTLLFEREAAGRGHYRLIPDRRVRLPEFSREDLTALGVPVGLAFFVRQADGTVMAHYPSPAGATRWDVDQSAWATVERRFPPLRDLEPGVRALLVNTARGGREQWLVPIDDCYRLVALIGREWRGLSGGGTVWPAIEKFFAGLAAGTGPAGG